jgi:peptide/nickel transport system permease protein
LRLGERMAVLFAVVIINFFIFVVLPAIAHVNPAALYLPKSTEGINGHEYALQLANLERVFGLDQPLSVRFVKYIVAMYTFNFGLDYTGSPVLTIIESHFWFTFMIIIPALIISTMMAISMGVYAASKKGKVADHASSLLFQLTYNIPSFWVAIIILVIFGGILRWFPLSLTSALIYANGSHVVGLAYYEHLLWAATLPIITLSFLSFGARALLMRNNSVDSLESDFVTQARVRGVRESKIMSRHVRRNSILPVFTRVGIDVAFLLSGIVFIEYAFNFTGLGSLLVTAALSYDIPFLEADFFVISLMAVMIFLVMDLVYPLLDPRVRYG